MYLCTKPGKANASLNLSPLNLTNEAHTISAHIVAIDNKDQRSDAYIFEVQMQPDTSAPLAGINRPIPNSTLYHGDTVEISWKAVDESGLAQIDMLVEGSSIYSQALTETSEKGTFDPWLGLQLH